MSAHTQLVVAVFLTGLCVIGTVSFVGWLICSLVMDLLDHLMQQSIRRRHSRFDGARAAKRNAFRDVRGVHR